MKRAYAWKFFFTLRPEFFQNRIANFRFISTIETIGGFILTNGCLHPAPRKFHGFDSASVGKKPKVLNLTIQLFEVRPSPLRQHFISYQILFPNLFVYPWEVYRPMICRFNVSTGIWESFTNFLLPRFLTVDTVFNTRTVVLNFYPQIIFF